MTAEVIVMNRLAAAIAADSAVTVRLHMGQKVYQSANKLFALSKYAPVGIMFYGSASFMEIPWETIVKLYRQDLKDQRFPHLEKYAESFLSFVKANRTLFPDSAQSLYVEIESKAYLFALGVELRDIIAERLASKKSIKLSDVKRAITNSVKRRLRELRDMDAPEALPKTFPKRVAGKYSDEIDLAISEVYEDLPLTETAKGYLKELLAEVLYRNIVRLDTLCGLVFIGFGEEEVFPKAIEYHTRGIVDNRLWIQPSRTAQVERRNQAVIIPFAQSEMVSTFMEGVDPSYHQFMRASLQELFAAYSEEVAEALEGITSPSIAKVKTQLQSQVSKSIGQLIDGLDQYRQRQHVDPIMAMIGALPMDELARAAEALVNLTSFKRRVSAEAETVAEPIDVAVISRGDGFVWIKRKHYFPQQLNPTWAMRYIGD